MKKLVSIILFAFVSQSFCAQLISDSVSMQANYSNQVFYSLENGEVSSVDNNNWSIAFAISSGGAEGSSILLNEATSTLWAYPGTISNWSSFDTTNQNSWERLLNTDTTWTNGAFNLYRGASGSFDMGWGVLNPSLNFWTFGDSLYLIKLSDNSYRKLWIVSLKSGVWEFKYANIDGSDEHLVTFSKSTYSNKNFVYYDMINHQLIDREPDNNSWDLTFIKNIDYVSPPGTFVAVTSVFSNKKVWSAKAHEIDYAAATTSTTPQTALTKKIDNIGREWKKFNSGSGWEVYDSIAYFLYNNDSTGFYRIVFTGFNGSSDGTTYFTKELIQAIGFDELKHNNSIALYPNPANNYLNLLLNNDNSDLLIVEIVDLSGKLLDSKQITTTNGTHQYPLDISHLNNGCYFISVKSKNIQLSQKFIKQ